MSDKKIFEKEKPQLDKKKLSEIALKIADTIEKDTKEYNTTYEEQIFIVKYAINLLYPNIQIDLNIKTY